MHETGPYSRVIPFLGWHLAQVAIPLLFHPHSCRTETINTCKVTGTEFNKKNPSFLNKKNMASVKAEKTTGSQPAGPAKKEPAKGLAPKQGSGPAKGEQKPREPRKKGSGGKGGKK